VARAFGLVYGPVDVFLAFQLPAQLLSQEVCTQWPCAHTTIELTHATREAWGQWPLYAPAQMNSAKGIGVALKPFRLLTAQAKLR
jgi:hypothetical protein